MRVSNAGLLDRGLVHIEYTIPHPRWYQLILGNDIKALHEMAFDPNENPLNVRFMSPLYYAVKAGNADAVRMLLAMGAQVFAGDIIELSEWCPHDFPGRLSYDCCIIRCLLQHAHDLPPRLCAAVWCFAQMSGTWRDLVQPVVEERMCKEEL